MTKNPTISVIIPTYNEEKRIGRCIGSILSQDYPKEKIEIIIVDDNSIDETAIIAKKLGAEIVINGSKNIERGKSIGFSKSSGEYVFFIDADNELLSDGWFKQAIDIFNTHSNIIGVQSYRYKYYKSDPAVNRYCALFGVNDPMAFYLGKRGQLMQTEDTWMYEDTLLEDRDKYFYCKFTTNNLPTVGSQGYMTKRSFLNKTNWEPYLFHMDSVYELVGKGNDEIAFIKYDIRHDYSETIRGMLKKLRRNIVLFQKQREMRKYKYDLSAFRLIGVAIIMGTLVIPFYHAALGYSKKQDVAWFLHPLLSIMVIFLYVYSVIEYNLKSFFLRNNV